MTARMVWCVVPRLLAVTVALVLADSAVVALVAWVLISFNLVLGLGVVPAAIGFARFAPSTTSTCAPSSAT